MGTDSNGHVTQSCHTVNRGDYSSEGGMLGHFLGVVLRVYSSDDTGNKCANLYTNTRGPRTEADVMIVNDGIDSPWPVPNVVILPHGACGIDNFHEELPRGSEFLIDGTRWDGNMSVDAEKLSGDWCLVSFIGGVLTQPVMTHWFPHPSNRYDPATQGVTGDTLIQGRRLFKRYAGARMTVTSKGSVFLDTNESHSLISAADEGAKRQKREDGGDVVINVKPARKLEVNFNRSVPDPDEPSLPQPNPEQGQFARSTDNTIVRFTQNEIELIAKEAVKIISQNADIILQPAVNLLLGSETADERMVLGDTWKSIMSGVLLALTTHTHGTGVGPSGPPLDVDPNTALSTFTAAYDDVENDEPLSSFIKGQKDPLTSS